MDDYPHTNQDRCSDEETLQLVEIAGDPYVAEGWLFIPVHTNGGTDRHPYRHIQFALLSDAALDLAETVYGLLLEELRNQAGEIGVMRDEFDAIAKPHLRTPQMRAQLKARAQRRHGG